MVLFGCRNFTHPISGVMHITSHGFNQSDTQTASPDIWYRRGEATPQRSRTWLSHMFWAPKVRRDRTLSHIPEKKISISDHITLGSEREGKKGLWGGGWFTAQPQHRQFTQDITQKKEKGIKVINIFSLINGGNVLIWHQETEKNASKGLEWLQQTMQSLKK